MATRALLPRVWPEIANPAMSARAPCTVRGYAKRVEGQNRGVGPISWVWGALVWYVSLFTFWQ